MHKQPIIRRFFLGIIVLSLPILFFSSKTSEDIREHAATTTVQVSLNPATTAQSISSDFLGSSVEPWRLCDMQHFDQASPVSAQLFRTLGNGLIRIGGASGDHTIWTPNGTPSCSFNGTVVTKGLVDAIFSFAKKTNRKLTYIINLETNTPSSAASEATYAAQSGGTQLAAFEIGNEPDLYGWSFSQYQTNWEAIYNAVHAAVPNVPIVGPSVSYQTNFFTSAVTAEGSKYITATAHPYATVAGNTSPSQLISKSTTDSMIGKIDGFYNAAKTKNLPLGLNETNAVANTPPASVGDAFDMSLWGADYTFTAAEHNASSMEFHGAIPGDETSPFNGSGNTPGIRPLYYGMLLFHYAVGDSGKVIPVQYSSSINLRAHAVLRSDGKVAVALVNEDQGTAATVQINTTQSYSSAQAISLTAPSLTATVDQITLGGSHVDLSTGNWTPTQITPVSVSGNTSSVTIPPLSAMVILYGSGTTPSITTSQTPTNTPATTPNPSQSGQPFLITTCLHGLGNCGDNVTPGNGGNTSPQHQTRSATITVLNQSGSPVGTAQGIITYTASAQNFQGTIAVPGISPGQYLLSIKTDGFLSKQVPGIVTITSSPQSITLQPASEVTGDINNDDQLDLLDYNLLISCFGSKQTTSSCTTPPTQQSPGADINDDGHVDGIDYNEFIRELSVQHS